MPPEPSKGSTKKPPAGKHRGGRGGGKSKPTPVNARKKRRDAEAAELLDLAERTKDPALLKGDHIVEFTDLPISRKTLDGLVAANFVQMTEIQRESLPKALCGRDVLGAAKTGSGKTLAFIVPILERLYQMKWSADDGLGALVLSPTRELALQIFQVLRKVGAQHAFSAGLIIGGKDVKTEKDRLNRMNILIATPGRLLQHMDETPGFDADHLQLLVLDEADRILDMGFEKSVNAIIDFLPKHRQTLLFSATQTKSVRDLARLSLSQAEYVAVHDAATSSTPTQLTQAYVVTPLPDKLDLLWSFIRAHLGQKSLVFLSSCKQVRFVYEAFRKMQPGIPLMHMHGKQKQAARLAVYEAFSKTTACVLFATDIAARGLDFPAVHWVVQVDAPEDAPTYIHRVGRTARYQDGGNALMFLLPSEEQGMLAVLKDKVPTLRRIKINPSKTVHVSTQLEALCSQFTDMKYLAQKAFATYVKSIYLQSNKNVFDVHALPLQEYAAALGLLGMPKVKFLKKKKGAAVAASAAAASADEDDGKDAAATAAGRKTRVDRMLKRKNMDILSEHYNKMIDRSEDEAVEGGDDKKKGGKPKKEPKPKAHAKDVSDDESDSDEDVRAARAGDDDSDDEVRKPGLAGSRRLAADSDDSDADESDADRAQPAAAALTGFGADGESDSDDGLLTIKRRNHELEQEIDALKLVPQSAPSHRRVLREREKARKKLPARDRLVFDDEGNPVRVYSLEDEQQFRASVDVDQAKSEYLAEQRAEMAEVDVEDKQRQRERLREKKREKKRKQRAREGVDADDDGGDDEVAVTLGGSGGGAGYASSDADDDDEDHAAPRAKRRRTEVLSAMDVDGDNNVDAPRSLAMDEELALKLLQGMA
ncbi:ATP-dependent RNA helicase dbp4 [Allomyces javanicus]|nr:ATP-dependent RNA helicase dbp4 [Allomyces javanicus]